MCGGGKFLDKYQKGRGFFIEKPGRGKNIQPLGPKPERIQGGKVSVTGKGTKRESWVNKGVLKP